MVWALLASVSRWYLSTVGASGCRFDFCKVSSPWFLVRLKGLLCRSIVDPRGRLPVSYLKVSSGVVRHPAHEERPSQVQSHHQFVQAQHYLGSSRPPSGRATLFAKGARRV